MEKQKEEIEDRKIRDLFKTQFQPDHIPSDDFNRRVMNQVMADWVSQPRFYTPIVDKQNRWWIVPAVLVLFALGFMYDAGLFTGESHFQWVDNFGGAFQSLYSWVEPVHLLVLGASLAVGLLLAIDQLLQKLSNI
ncbi:hypothetical protein [Marinilabilia salmonicolor]|uniref:hypothetical protein n=1 Tax=Marinilabilia salmonicolor TaxID=989 RepID=UPI00029A2577|nr:hypothetical protein [Marinilabilia salmonicolor]